MKTLIKNYIVTPLIALIFFHVPTFAQTYQFQFKKDQLELYTSIGLNIGLHIYDRLRPSEIFDDYWELDKNALWSIDRDAVNHYSHKADRWSDVLLYTSILSPAAVYLTKYDKKNKVGNIFLMGVQGFLIQDAMNLSFKIMAERPRPYMYNFTEETLLLRSNKNDTKSFYSGHVSTSAYFSFFCARVLTDLNPESKLIPVYWTLASSIPALTGYLRFKAGKHFPTDIIMGYIVGASYGILIPAIYKARNINLDAIPGGARLTVTFN